MAKLIMTLDGQPINEFELDRERITIGRKPYNDIPIDNLAVSSEHAAITTILNDSFLEDLGSTNGTLVNDAPIKKHVLQHGDEIEIGKYRLKYVNLQAIGGKSEAPDFEKTMILRPASSQTPQAKDSKPGDWGTSTIPLVISNIPKPEKTQHTENTAPAAAVEQPAQASGAHAVIQILNGPNAGKELELTKTLTSLGKPGVQVAVITRRPHGHFLTHVEGSRRPVVNDQMLDAHPRQLSDHDVIELGGVKMEFYLK